MINIFSDIETSRWSYNDIKKVYEEGLMSGYSDNTFRPENSITREELASVIARMTFRDGLFTDVLPFVKKSVVAIYRNDGGIGSGAIITPQGHIITNRHVIEGAKLLTMVDENKNNMPINVVAISNNHDLALVKINYNNYPYYLNITNKDVVQGEHIGIYGNPKGFIDSFTQGQISHINRYEDRFQTDAPINPGNSGGIAINEKGEIIGIVVSKYVDVDVEGIAFCIHANTHVREFLKQNKIYV